MVCRFNPYKIRALTIALLLAISPGVYPKEAGAQTETETVSPELEKAEGLFQEGMELFRQGTAASKQEAIAKLEAALPLYERGGDRGSMASTLTNIGVIYAQLGEREKALEYYQRALPIFKEVGDRNGEASALTNIGRARWDMGEPQAGLEDYQQALNLFREDGDRAREAVTLNNIGMIYADLGDRKKAIEYYEQALPLRRESGDTRGEAVTLVSMGTVYHYLGQTKEALESYQQALPLLQQAGDPIVEGLTFNNIGSVYSDTGELQKALESYQQALPLFENSGYAAGEALALNNIGLLYSDLGEATQALEYYEEALALHRKINDPIGEGNALKNMGSLHSRIGELEKALEYYQQALPIFEAASNPRGKASTLSSMGVIYSYLKEREKALEYYQQALTIREQIGDRSGEATTLYSLGAIYSDSGEYDKAGEYFQQALSLTRATGERQSEANVLFHSALLKERQKQLEEGINLMEEAIAIIEQLRAKIDSSELRSSYFATVQDYYKYYIDLLMQLHQQQPNKGFDARALEASEQARARSLLELLVEARTDIRQGIKPELLQREQLLQRELDILEKQRVEILTGDFTEEQKKALEAERDALLARYQQLQTEIRASSPAYAALKYPEPLTVAEIQRDILDEETILLEYSLGDERSYAWIVTKEEILSYQLPPRKEIVKAVVQLRNTFTREFTRKNLKFIDKAADPLTELILEPLGDRLGNKRLVVVPDESLLYIPFSALSQPGTTGEADGYQPLMLTNEIVNLPSISALAILREQTGDRPPAPKALAILADPVFGLDDERVVGGNGEIASADIPLESQQISRAAEASGVKWDRLPGTRQEAEAILAIASPDKVTLSYGFEANKENATSPELGEYRIVHFATHGLASDEKPELSAIVMSLVDKNGNWENGYLRLTDIFNLNLPAELVVLSACQTGLGTAVIGEGLVGLTRGFMYAGAPRVVTSLWRVDDAGTAELMSHFYQGVLERGLSPAAALREAQLAMWQQEEWQSPYYWSAFTLQGEWLAMDSISNY
jgi:CHAT domain-containing protein